MRNVTGPVLALIVGITCGLSGTTAFGQAGFLDTTASAGITGGYLAPPGHGGGVAAADFDNDGDIDFFLPGGEGEADRLYENLGGGVFTDIAAGVGLDSTVANRAALWFDYDGDHDLDLVVAGDSFGWPAPPPPDADYNTLRLYRQIGVASGTFEDVTAAAGLDVPLIATPAEHLGSMIAGDINNDGYLDLYVVFWKGFSRMFLNDGNGAFTDISASSGLFNSLYKQWQPMFHDFDGDGWLDIYAAVDFGPNLLWINQGDNTFVDLAIAAGADNFMNDMGMSLGDYDGDGDLDIYVSNIFIPADSKHGILYRNDSIGGVPSFVEVSAASGVDDCSWGWGTSFLDADNDGRLDLAVTNGFHIDPFYYDNSRLFYNNADDPVTFSDIAVSAGFDDSFWGFSLIAFDYDRDGDLDTLQTTQNTILATPQVRLMENQADLDVAPGNYLVIKPRMTGNNHFAIGTVVRISAGGIDQMRLITAGTSMIGQEPAEAHFGLGSATMVDSVTIEWPNGAQDILDNVDVNQVLTVSDAIPCQDVRRFQARCKQNKVEVRVTLFNSDHDMKTVTIDIGGNTKQMDVNGRKANHRFGIYNGLQTVSLIEPGGCANAIEVDCN